MRRPLALGLLLLAAPATAAAARPLDDSAAQAACGATDAGVTCGPGSGRRTAGGGDKVSHAGWPAITGILWQVHDSADHTQAGSERNDELLGHHGDDHLDGGPGRDVLWGDGDPSGNTTAQRDVLRGGAGGDWIYPSHGRTVVRAGAGNDHVWAFYGSGTIDCGSGRDTVRVRENGAFRLRGCEVVQHFCSFGAKADGSCRKPGEAAATRPPDPRGWS